MAFYRPLDHTKNEVRMLKILDVPDGDTSGLVHCRLEHASLDDLTPEFTQFLSKTNQHCNGATIQSWIRHFDSKDNRCVPPPASHLKLPVWRWKMEYEDADMARLEWNDIMKAIDIDPSQCPTILSPPLDKPRTLELGEPKCLQEFSFVPRFQWGDFEAISYCWQSEVRNQKIVIDQTIFEVPENLEALLHRLQHLPDTKSGMKFWVDALCINQRDIDERSHQVKLMQSIYEKSFAVIVWLGEAADKSEEAIDFISSVTLFTVEEEKALNQWGREINNSLPWRSLLSFFSRNYWRRLWIIQELALNHNMTLFLCGGRQLSRSMIYRTCEFYQRHSTLIDDLVSKRWEVSEVSPVSTYGSIWSTIYQIHCLVTTEGQEKKKPRLDVLLDLGRKANVTDPRDKVYGILGLLPSPIATKILPDYLLPREEVFLRFAKTLLQEVNGLEAILSWCCFKADSSLPSWIPDWTKQFPRNHIRRLRERNAAGSTAAQWSVSEDDRHLHCKGVIFDSVRSFSSCLSENLPYGSQAPKEPQEVLKSSGNISLNRYGDRTALHNTLWRTLRQDHPSGRDLKATFLDTLWLDWDNARSLSLHMWALCYGMEEVMESSSWETFDKFRQTNANFSIFGNKFRDFFPDTRNNFDGQLCQRLMSPEKEIIFDMHVTVLALIGRRMITTSGGYLGLAPEEVLENDVIAILYGCNFPIVLRPCGESYNYIGESYVDGIMDGELMEAKERGEYREVNIALC
jgi:hypothetical protein